MPLLVSRSRDHHKAEGCSWRLGTDARRWAAGPVEIRQGQAGFEELGKEGDGQGGDQGLEGYVFFSFVPVCVLVSLFVAPCIV